MAGKNSKTDRDIERIRERTLATYGKPLSAAAEDFIRNAKARNARSQAEKDASLRAQCERVLAAMASPR